MKKACVLGLKLVVLTFGLFACFAFAAAIVGPFGPPSEPVSPAGAAAIMVFVCLLDTLVITFLVLRSDWTGWRLAAGIFIVFYGCMTLLSQIETAVFVPALPAGVLPRLFALGALVAAPFSVLAVLVLGKRKPGAAIHGADMPHTTGRPDGGPAFGDLAGRVTLLVAAYLILYFGFGYYVAWQSPEVRAYYGGIDHGSLLAGLGVVLRQSPWQFALQAGRALLWIAVAWPILQGQRGTRLEIALAVGLAFAVLMNAQILLPNPFMPAAVRWVHLAETAPSNFLFGILTGWLLARNGRHQAPARPSATRMRSAISS